jgi:hypothetical protein
MALMIYVTFAVATLDLLTNFNMRTAVVIAILAISTTFLVGCSLFAAEGDTQQVQEEQTPQEEGQMEEQEPEETPVEEPTTESAEILLAKCLTEKGTKLYTATWCGHCQNQKAAFKDGLQYLDNVECADGDTWSQACKDAEVQAVPTWIFGDGEKLSGNRPLAQIAEAAGCDYPAGS